jgi:putative membrane protein
MMGGYGDFAGMGFGMLGMALVWLLVTGGIVVLVLWAVGGLADALPGRGRSALDVLAERYAKGEIDRDEFERKRRDLGAGQS